MVMQKPKPTTHNYMECGGPPPEERYWEKDKPKPRKARK